MSDLLANIPLGALRVFEAAARQLSFTRAANELGLTPATVAGQMRSLERRLGQALFHRLPRTVSLTPAGERLAEAAGEAMGLLRAAVSELTDTSEAVLAITTLQSLATQWLAPRLPAFQLAHPNIAVRLETDARVSDLERENFDVALRRGSGDWPGLESVYLAASAVTPLCTPDLAGRHGGFAKPQDLLVAPLIGPDRDWAAWFAAAGATFPDGPSRPRLSSGLQTIEVASALAGHGVALGSPVLFAADIAEGRLMQPFEAMLHTGPGLWLAYPKARRRAHKIVAFRDWLLATIAKDPALAGSTASHAAA